MLYKYYEQHFQKYPLQDFKKYPVQHLIVFSILKSILNSILDLFNAVDNSWTNAGSSIVLFPSFSPPLRLNWAPWSWRCSDNGEHLMNRKLDVESRFHFFYCYDWPTGEEESKDDDQRQKGGLCLHLHQRPSLCRKSFSFSWSGQISNLRIQG